MVDNKQKEFNETVLVTVLLSLKDDKELLKKTFAKESDNSYSDLIIEGFDILIDLIKLKHERVK